MSARQVNAQEAIVSITSKMEAMLQQVQQQYDQSVTLLTQLNTTMTVDVGQELKKQTSILMSIEAKIGAGGGSSGEDKALSDNLGILSKGLGKLVSAAEKIKPKAGERVKEFLGNIAEGLISITEKIDEKKAEAISNLISTLGKGVLLFGLTMTLYSILGPTAMLGATLFGLTVRLLMKSAGVVDENSVKGMAAVASLGLGVLYFGLAMTLYVILAVPAMLGAVLFGLTVRLLMKSAGVVDENSVKGMAAVAALGLGVLYFGLALTVYAVLAVPAMLGAVLFGLTVRLLMKSAGMADAKAVAGMQALVGLGKSILIFGLVMLALTIVMPIVIIGALLLTLTLKLLSYGMKEMGEKNVRKGIINMALGAIAIIILGLTIIAFAKEVPIMSSLYVLLTIGAFALAFYVLGKYFDNILKGALAIAAVGLGIAFLALGLYFYKSVGMDWESTAMLGATIVGLGIAMWGFGKFSTEISKGALALAEVAVAFIIFGVGLAIMGAAVKQLSWENIAMIGAVIVGMGLIATVLGIGPIPGFAMAGAAVLVVLGAALVVFSVGFLIIATAMQLLDAKSIVNMGNAITTIGMSMVPIGLMSPLVILGAAAMIVAGAALVPLTIGLGIFRAIGWKPSDGVALENAMGAVINGFLGGPMPGGILAGIKFAAGAAARAALLFITVPPMILAGVALMSISLGLMAFKKSGFTQADSANMEAAIGGIVGAFSLVTDKERQKKMGINVNWMDLMLGIMALSQAGNTLSSLAKGIQAFANLSVIEYEVIGAGTKNAKIVPKGITKLSKSDFELAAFGMAQVISAIAAPFALVGKLEKGEPSGNPFYDAIFGGGFVSSGITALARSGDTLVNLAQGVKAFANLEITEFEVINAGTKNAKIVPKSVKKMSKTDFIAAGENIAQIIGVVAKAFADVGRMESESSGWFSGGFITKGVEALAGVGGNLKSITESVLMMANRQIPQFEVINPGTKNAKVVPAKPLQISDKDLTNAATTIMDILQVVASGFYNIGKMEDDSSSFWGDGYISKGVKAIGGIGDTVSKVTESVIKIATGTFTPMTAVGSGKDAKLVPGTPIKVSDSMLKASARTINSILDILGHGMYKFGKFYEDNADTFDAAFDAIPSMSDALAKLAEVNEKWSKIGDADKGLQSFRNFNQAVMDTYDPAKQKNLPQQAGYMLLFVKGIERLAAPAEQLGKVASNVERIEAAMKNIKTHVNGFDMERLTKTDSMFKSMAILSKSPEAMAARINDTLKDAFKEFGDALSKAIKEAAAESGGGGGGIIEGVKDALTPGENPKGGNPQGNPKGNAAPPITAAMIKTAMAQALGSATITVKPAYGSQWPQ